MQKIKIIIGASYGDEGKGLATDFFAATAQKGTALNVLTNGGPQRGHTVELADGRRHVFKHFGAASFRGAHTYFAEQFLVNPMEFIREFDELSDVHEAPVAFMHPACRFTTPWDMLTNQLLQEKRGLHNSCGFGIWETVLRYQRGFGLSFAAFTDMSRDDRIACLQRLRDGYFIRRLQELDIAAPMSKHSLAPVSPLYPAFSGGAGLWDFFFSDDLLLRFEEDCESMRYLCPVRNEDYLKCYPTVLFENAQGLLLDGNKKEESEFTTPSTTGAGRIIHTVERVFEHADVEVCYVTRSYLTRHGDGTVENELAAEALSRCLPGVRPDATNAENRFQGALRYGLLDTDRLSKRILTDFAHCAGNTGNLYHPSVMITHMNEHAGIDTDRLAQTFDTLYVSNGRTSGDVFERKGM